MDRHSSAVFTRKIQTENFLPAPGRIAQYVEPGGPGVRVDSGVYAGWNVPLDYDPLLAKLSVWAATREEAIARMRRAVREFQILGTTNNLSLFAGLLQDERFVRGDLHTGFLADFMARPEPTDVEDDRVIAAVLAVASTNGSQTAATPAGNGSAWKQTLWKEVQR